MYCQDVGTYIWSCTKAGCDVLVCVGKFKGERGCIDASPDDITNRPTVDPKTFWCPECHRISGLPIPVCLPCCSRRFAYSTPMTIVQDTRICSETRIYET